MESVSKTQVVEWAAQLLEKCDKELSKAERSEQLKYATLIQNPKDKVFLSRLLDESSQIRGNKKLAERVKFLIDEYGVPKFFGSGDNFLLKAYQYGGYMFDSIAMPIFKKRLRSETSAVIIDEARPNLTKHLDTRYKAKIGQNVNLLGEVVVGDGEAQKRFEHYVEALSEPDINYISIKISGIYAQLQPLNFVEARKDLIEKLSVIFRACMQNTFVDSDGKQKHKFVNLDMEEYKDAHLTMDVFKATLALDEFKNFSAGLVIQAYLPDAELFMEELLEFAHKRVADGGAALKVRIVKGANLEMETVVSSTRGWANPVRTQKVDSDAAHMRMIDLVMQPENAKVLKVGIASHNLFSIGYAYLTAQQRGVMDSVSFEMLEGMANNLWRAMSTYGVHIILYTPVVKDEHFLNAVSYLVRRLDENTGPENFLSYSFNLKQDSKEWNFLKDIFHQAYDRKDTVSKVPTRTQDRSLPYAAPEFDGEFHNEPDTNFDLVANKKWAESIVAKWKTPATQIIPLQKGAEQTITDKKYQYEDRMQSGVVSYEMSMASSDDIQEMVDIAYDDSAKWAELPLVEKNKILRKAGDLIAEKRGDLIGVMASVTSKTLMEGDVEVSEAIDFCRFYPKSMMDFDKISNLEYTPQGVVVVISPWNFPLAIPVGGVAAALSGGNRVILKPASVAAPVMWEACQCFWEAGVPKEALQIVITDGREPLSKLTTSEKVSHIILTGGTDTAQSLATANPKVRLSAETGGKNAMILTSRGDRDKAIMNAVASAFGNAGQKCSACSLFLVEADVFDDPSFKEKLMDAASSMHTGSPWDLGTLIGPMITNQNDKLLQSVNNPANMGKWLISPQFLDDKKYLLKPTILWDVKPEDFEFKTELFAPVLSVVRFKGIDEAIRLVNSSDYGLTSGLQSLDEREIAKWKDSLVAGNLYINRGVTGAIVNRQPFGGMKLSAFGGGIKAGGVNYVSCFVDFKSSLPSNDYEAAYAAEFAKPRDVNNIYGEQNVFRYLPLKSMALRVMQDDKLEDVALVVRAAKIAGTKLTVSVENGYSSLDGIKMMGVDVKEENLWEFIATIPSYSRIRTLSKEIPSDLYKAAAGHNKYIATAPVSTCGRVELLHYLQEQSIAYEYHRYGSITEVPEV